MAMNWDPGDLCAGTSALMVCAHPQTPPCGPATTRSCIRCPFWNLPHFLFVCLHRDVVAVDVCTVFVRTCDSIVRKWKAVVLRLRLLHEMRLCFLRLEVEARPSFWSQRNSPLTRFLACLGFAGHLWGA